MQYNEIQIRSKSAIVYTQYANTANKTSFQSAQQIESNLDRYNQLQLSATENKGSGISDKRSTYSGQITKGSKKRMTKAVSLLVQSSKTRRIYNHATHRYQLFKLSFITLTVSSTSIMLAGKEAHEKLLEPFLLYLRRKHQVVNYVWKAELQERGQIHYHIMIDKFVLYTDIRDKWNNLQDQYGLLDDYRAKHGSKTPNSTDVHSIKKVKNIEAYLVKYISKDVGKKDGDSIGGKVWDCNMSLKKAKYYTTTVDWEMERVINYVQTVKIAQVLHYDHYSLIIFTDQDAYYLLNERQRDDYFNHLSLISDCDLLSKR